MKNHMIAPGLVAAPLLFCFLYSCEGSYATGDGSTDPTAINYDATAETDDGSCTHDDWWEEEDDWWADTTCALPVLPPLNQLAFGLDNAAPPQQAAG